MRNKVIQLDKRARIKLRTGGRSRVKIRRLALAVVMTFLLAVPAAASAMEVTIPYQQSFTNDSAEASVADTFDYQLTAANASSPMPAGSGGVYGFSLKGNTSGKLNLDISYPKPGYYYYTVKSKVHSPASGYTYNKKKYTIMVMVVNGTGGLVIRSITIQDANQKKYNSLVFKTKYYKERPGEKKKKKSGGGSGGSGSPAAVAPPEVPLDDTDVDIDTPAPIYTPEAPAVEPEEDWWALINLIAMLLTLLTAIVAGILYFKRRRDQNEDEPDPEDLEDPSRFRRSGWLRLAIVVVAIISLILFILTEDMTLPMRLVDEWTIWMIILLAIALLLALISRKVTAEEEDNVETNPEG